ncbi:MAG: DUF6778 family protein [Pseudomonadota bacterium]
MGILRTTLACCATALIAGCGNFGAIATDVAPLAAAETVSNPRDYSVSQINIMVPETLTVSEAHSYFPRADIVWREDPPGDRRQQIAAVLNTAAERGTAGFDGGREVALNVEVVMFHALTERARYSVGGVHDIDLLLSVTDAETGAVIEPPREINAALRGFGGARAVEANLSGEVPKVRLTEHLAGVFQAELMGPVGGAGFTP